MHLSWGTPSNNGGGQVEYVVHRRPAGSDRGRRSHRRRQRIHRSRLTTGTTYYFRVYALNPAGWSRRATGRCRSSGKPGKPAACTAYQVSPDRNGADRVEPSDQQRGTPITGYNVAISDYGNHIVFSKYVPASSRDSE